LCDRPKPIAGCSANGRRRRRRRRGRRRRRRRRREEEEEACTRQRWLGKRASVLGYRHIVFLVFTGLEETTERYSAPFPNLFPTFHHIL
jgi:hypothetical protein